MLCFSRLTSNNASAQAAILSKYAFFQGITVERCVWRKFRICF